MGNDVAERVYTTVDKSQWGEGAWTDEPDKVQWKDEATGLPCLANRGPLGAWCGYVGVNADHPLYESDYYISEWGEELSAEEKARAALINPIEVHGGLTYAAHCAHGPEESSICHIPDPGDPDDVWWFGFDCAHSGDIVPAMEARDRERGWAPIRAGYESYADLAYVRSQVERLAKQLASVEAAA